MARPRGIWADKAWRDAIRKAVNQRDKDGSKALERLANKLVRLGEDGDVSALKEIGDRLDGKATQAIEANVNTNFGDALERAHQRRLERERGRGAA
jgi:hypothetical protein